MTTTPDVRAVLREWMETHTNLWPVSVHVLCDKAELVSNSKILRCAVDAKWTVDFGPESVGPHPRCERHTVQVIKAWAGFEAAAQKRLSA